jgi:hypothetical protein
VFGSRVCVKQAGERAGKLDRNDFTGIFLGYTATDQNVQYIDLTSGIVKTSHHADFDEAWYLQPTRPPAAQLLYDLGLEVDEPSLVTTLDATPPQETTTPINTSNLAELSYVAWHPPMIWRHQPLHLVTTNVPWPPMKSHSSTTKWEIPALSRISPLPLRESASPPCTSAYRPHTAAAARLVAPCHATEFVLHDEPEFTDDMFSNICLRGTINRTTASLASELVSEFMITQKDIAPLYVTLPVL